MPVISIGSLPGKDAAGYFKKAAAYFAREPLRGTRCSGNGDLLFVPHVGCDGGRNTIPKKFGPAPDRFEPDTFPLRFFAFLFFLDIRVFFLPSCTPSID
jgi:hypothetical protein